jgi:vacuolar-type H+-ATPase subunit D/Vma8
MTANELRDWAILGRIVEQVEETKRFCGETLLQKSAYFLKEMFGAPIAAPFRIYYFENKLQMLGREIQHVTRRTRVLEERVLPRLKVQIRSITHYIGEREREAHFRLKRFKTMRGRVGQRER